VSISLGNCPISTGVLFSENLREEIVIMNPF
jgi:hypothetical protein